MSQQPPPRERDACVPIRCQLHGSLLCLVTAHGIELKCRSCRGLIHFIPHSDIEKMRRGLAFLEETTPQLPADPPA